MGVTAESAKHRGRGMKRRHFMAALGALALPAVVRGQLAPGSRPRLAIVSPAEPEALMQDNSENRYHRALFAELRRLGHVEGQNLTVERYGREKDAAGSGPIVETVIKSKPDVIYVIGPGAFLFKQATSTIPIVALTGDPLQQRLIDTLAHPGGNVTGVSVDAGPTIYGKRVALLHEMFPGMKRLAFLTSRFQWEGQVSAVRAAAKALGAGVVDLPFDLPTGEAVFRDAIAKAKGEDANAIMVGDNPDTMTNRALIADLIGQAGWPAIYPFVEFVDVGGLMAYSFDLTELFERAADDIHAILGGANPGDIPFYQASKFELSLNLKTAKALSLNVPATLLAAAERVVE
jgi:putative tryptophan/tyrosine transport system substrate-binding protein